MNIAIVAVAYNRIESISRLLSSLDRAYYDENVTLIISIDKSNTTKVEEYADSFIWKYGTKKVVRHKENMGLRKHILSIGEYLNEYDALVVLEDDLVVSPSFWFYAKASAVHYRDDVNVAGISLYSYHINPHTTTPFFPMITNKDTYFLQYAPSWGQVWLKKQWKEFKLWYDCNSEEFTDAPHLPYNICHWGKKSWLKYHTKYAIEHNKFFVYPYDAYSTTCGDLGEHAIENTSYMQVSLMQDYKKDFNFTRLLNAQVMYDAFFERIMSVGEFQDVCIDLYGQKRNKMKNRYWLTTSAEKFKVLKSYRLTFKPYELNAIDGNNGEDLFLYDTSEPTSSKPDFQRSTLLVRYDIQNLLRILYDYTLANLFKDIWHTFVKFIKIKL